MSDQLRLGEKPAASTRPRSVAQTSIGTVGMMRSTVSTSRPSGSSTSTSSTPIPPNRRERIPIENVRALIETLERAVTSSERRRARRTGGAP